MHKIIIWFLVIFSCVNAVAKVEDLYGTWQIENVTYTFEKDTVYIDEIDNEGFGYAYKYVHDTIYVYNEVYGNDTIVFKLQDLNKYTLSLIYLAEKDTFELKNTKYKNYYE